MAPHPTFVHAAADLHRQELLAEAVSDRHATPVRVRGKSSGPGKTYRRAIIWIADAVSRIVDDFEPGSARPRSLTTVRRVQP
jgi:hypothetical protein